MFQGFHPGQWGITYEGETDPSLPREIAWPEAIGHVPGIESQLFGNFCIFRRTLSDDGIQLPHKQRDCAQSASLESLSTRLAPRWLEKQVRVRLV